MPFSRQDSLSAASSAQANADYGAQSGSDDDLDDATPEWLVEWQRSLRSYPYTSPPRVLAALLFCV